jgi:hypothetical protein
LGKTINPPPPHRNVCVNGELMKQTKILATIIVTIILISTITATSYIILNKQKEDPFNNYEEETPQKPFYVGVTYCGNSVQEAKELIDKVKN